MPDPALLNGLVLSKDSRLSAIARELLEGYEQLC